MLKVYLENDVNPHALANCKVAVIGYGSQGRGQSLNLRDSGVVTVLGLRKGGKTWKLAEEEGWEPQEITEAVTGADIVCMLVPDMAQPVVFSELVAPHLKEGATVLFSHGFNIHYGEIEVPQHANVAMIAPKGPGAVVRRQYQAGNGVPCLVAVHHDATGNAKEMSLAFAHAIGGTRAGVLETTFAEETETDLFGEQAVLCGGVTELVTAGWETLVEAGYAPEIAYFECLHELKLIVDLIYEGGFTQMHKYVSDTAKYGDLTRGSFVIDDGTRQRMRTILQEIQNGNFAKEWKEEHSSGLTNFKRMLEADLMHPIEEVGQGLRAKFSWKSKTEEAAK